MKTINLIGLKNGSLEVVSIHSRMNGQIHWSCKCSKCDGETVYSSGTIRNTKRATALECQHCGHRKQTHGYTGTAIHNVWRNMLGRCTNQSHPQWLDYGGRGIAVCDRWMTFLNFLEDMGIAPFDGASIDRVNNDEGYSKSNCKWSTSLEQIHNQRPKKNTVWVLLDGEPCSQPNAARILGVPYGTLQSKVKRGVTSFFTEEGRRTVCL